MINKKKKTEASNLAKTVDKSVRTIYLTSGGAIVMASWKIASASSTLQKTPFKSFKKSFLCQKYIDLVSNTLLRNNRKFTSKYR